MSGSEPVKGPGNGPRIERILNAGQVLQVWLENTPEPLELPWFWVRDNSQDPESVNLDTMQRTVDSFAIDLDLRPASCEVVDQQLRVHWTDDSPVSVLPADLLASLAQGSGDHRSLWHSSAQVAATPLGFDEVVGTEDGLRRWTEAVGRHGFGLVTGAPGTAESVRTLADRVGYVRRSVFGDVWLLSSTVEDHADSAYDTTYLEPHTDGSYCHDGPGLQLFACAERSGTGGESVLLDGFAAAEVLRDQNPHSFELLTTVEVPAHYIEDGVELRARRPTIRLAPDGSVEQVTFNNYDRSPFLLPPDQLRRWHDAYSQLHDLIIDQDRWWTHRLEPGEVLLFDNWRCLHGRMVYTGARKFHGCYLNHEDLESRLRVLG